jgi:hypothetical protein
MYKIYITRNQPGSRAQFKHDESTGAYIVKEGRDSINWYNYQKKVLKAKLLPFAKECIKQGLVQLFKRITRHLIITGMYKRSIICGKS